MAKIKKGRDLDRWKSTKPDPQEGKLRIIGGQFRGHQIRFSGDPVTRPMKDNTREAVFNLVGGWIPGKIAFDVFAGSGAIGIEALSRQASHAVFVERHFPTVKIIRDNLQSLHVATQATVESSDTFYWSRQFFKSSIQTFNRQHGNSPWAVFCCPPYAFFEEKVDEMLELIGQFKQHAPADSLMIVESDQRFDLSRLPDYEHWQVRRYAPAIVSVWRDSSLDDA